ncbi:uncharacterized protein TRIADDRAFT_26050 [Trichoplax adhaerens]|uniref:Steroid dehydrogenase n=1 Tax=Trichoplax adhaerens TaxID=10228 RepID=B3RWI0_TRIAD|nr:hypothetical protein TRIADDRAFT_26050 [Trichoplax adhaerens]EDV25139.1 hypothetical protein TRIADDRAFT_26050 [Trichoplax adhaerens]|eukprot:XP_002113029.1 hypothetical protein TRIADDRAFT_26050 [Trichoplax adhaerens]
MNLYEILGHLGATYIIIRISLTLWHFLRLFVLPKLGFRLRLTKLGQWAIVTGSTDGIGKAYARELAHRGMNVLLISRNKDKLKAVKEELESHCHHEIKTLAIDFNQPKKIYQTISSEIQNLDVGILVNNVGIAYEYPSYYDELSDQILEQILNINVISAMEMTRLVLPKMIENKRGAIVNVASIAASVPMALMSVYSSSKAFLDFFSRSLNVEYNKDSIIIQSLIPGLICTKLSKVNKINLFAPSPETYAKQAVNTIGLCDRTTGYWPHELQYTYIRFMPTFWVQKEIYNTCKRLRTSALKHLEKEK